ncbi:hypothetical protein F3Y22_tig00110556pilonHSYRG00350 [Hibiscus syriacus]|uniref:RING-type E3 ubiquitin transferase n=1 Tax=Hibiscus syriacus TaxID=106335 RepID=A0A6A3ACC1_HIBSY|nr:hypothetical protein F3Y22_tig00110556pilonHSYRG00350 [Hibiscus syriacus]
MWYPKGSTSTSIKKGGGNGLVAVATDKDKGSQHAFRWAVEHLLSKKPNRCNGSDSSNLFLYPKRYSDVVKALTEYVSYAAIEKLVLGAPSRSGIMRKFRDDVPSCVSKASSLQQVSAPYMSFRKESQGLFVSKPSLSNPGSGKGVDNRSASKHRTSIDRGSWRVSRNNPVKQKMLPPTRASLARAFADLSESDTDISFVSSDRPSTDCGSSFLFDSFIDSIRNLRLSNCTDISVGSMRTGMRWADCSSQFDFSQPSIDSGRSSCSSQNLRSNFSKATGTSIKDRLEEVQQAEEAAMTAVEKEKAKCKAAESVQKRILSNSNIKYKRYSIEEIEKATENFAPNRKIGGGYGPVFKCYLEQTQVAVKVLRPDAAQGRLQFLQEIEVLSCIRHPNILLLLGACPEHGILVYEYMPSRMAHLKRCWTLQPDLDKEVLPELTRLKEIAEENMPPSCFADSEGASPTHD